MIILDHEIIETEETPKINLRAGQALQEYLDGDRGQ